MAVGCSALLGHSVSTILLANLLLRPSLGIKNLAEVHRVANLRFVSGLPPLGGVRIGSLTRVNNGDVKLKTSDLNICMTKCLHNQTMDNDLEICPHCGTLRVIIACDTTREMHGMSDVTRVEYFAKCAQCGAREPGTSVRSDGAMKPMDAIAAAAHLWNKRVMWPNESSSGTAGGGDAGAQKKETK